MSIPPFDLVPTVFPTTVDATVELGTVVVQPDQAKSNWTKNAKSNHLP